MIKHQEKHEWEKYPFGLVISIDGLEWGYPFKLSAVMEMFVLHCPIQ